MERVLPILSDLSMFGCHEEEFKVMCRSFRDRMGRLMGKRKKNKSRKIEQDKIGIHELVMRKSNLEGEYVGPFRVMNICSQGVQLRELKTGIAMSCGFENIRKLNYGELLRYFPHDIENSLNKFLEGLESKNSGKLVDKIDHKKEEDNRMCNINLKEISRREVIKASWIERKKCKLLKIEPKKSILVKTFGSQRDFSNLYKPKFSQKWELDSQSYRFFDKEDRLVSLLDIDRRSYNNVSTNREKGRIKYNSTFRSARPGTLELKNEPVSQKGITFTGITVHFYEQEEFRQKMRISWEMNN